MELLRAICIAFVLALAASANAQNAERWVGGNGAFSVDFAGHGWGALDPAGNEDLYDGELLIAVPEGDANRESRCHVEVRSMAAPNPVARAQLNDATRQMVHGDAMREMQSDPDYVSERVDTPTQDGVTTLDTYGRFMSLDSVSRRFWLMSGTELSMYTFSCAAPAENRQAVAQARAIANSLRFHLSGTAL